MPRSTLQATPRDVACKTRGQDGFATLLSCRALSSPPTRRFIPTLSGCAVIQELIASASRTGALRRLAFRPSARELPQANEAESSGICWPNDERTPRPAPRPLPPSRCYCPPTVQPRHWPNWPEPLMWLNWQLCAGECKTRSRAWAQYLHLGQNQARRPEFNRRNEPAVTQIAID